MLRTIAALVVWNAFATLAVAGAAWLTKIPLAIVGESVLVAELGIVAAVIVGAIVRRVKRLYDMAMIKDNHIAVVIM